MPPPPKPIDDIDLSDLCDKFVEFLRAVWGFIRHVCIAFWSLVSEAFWAAWTYPPFESFRNEFAAALIGLMVYVEQHPFISAAIFVLAYIVVPTVINTLRIALLHCLGFRRQGVLRGSYAANYQATGYGGNGVPRGSTFARLQSQGTKGGPSS